MRFLKDVRRMILAAQFTSGPACDSFRFEPWSIFDLRSTLIRTLVFAATLLASTPARSQGYDPYGTYFGRFNESNAIGAAAIDHQFFYCSWPEWTVTTPSVSAVELATGQKAWVKPARLAMPATFRIDEGWLQYETTDGDQVATNLTDGLRTLHLINAKSGHEIAIPTEIDRRSVVEECVVHHDRCLTFQGKVVSCLDGSMVGDLGPGEHHAIAADGKLIAITRVLKEQTFQFDKCLLREFSIVEMRLEHEMEIPIDVTWTLIAARGDFILARCEDTERLPQIACFDLARKTERWRIELPRGVRSNECQFVDGSRVMFPMGFHGPVWPLLVDLETGAISPMESWRDPQWMLAWHNQNGRYADMISSNSKVIVGKWRLQQMLAIDAKTGKQLWAQHSADYLMTRVFCEQPTLGDYLVAETDRGFDIIDPQTGTRRSVLPEQLGLERTPKRSPETLVESDNKSATTNQSPMNPLFLGSTSNDWIIDQGIFVLLAIPVIIWAVWAIIRWRNDREATVSVKHK